MKLRYKRKSSPTHELHLRNIYVFPTRSGMMLGVTLILLLITSINFQLNLGYALTFLIVGAAAASILAAFNTLHGLKLSIQRISPVFAGEQLFFSVDVENPKERTRYAIGVAIHHYPWRHHKNNWVWCDVLSLDRANVTLAIPSIKRGWHTLPELAVETQFPMGVFRIWSVWQPATNALVYAQQEKNPPLLSAMSQKFGEILEQGRASATQLRGEEYDAIRPYRAGDPLKQIYWKKILPSGDLLSRDTTSTQSADLWLSLESTGLSQLEAQLSRLTSWVLQAHKSELSYGLRLEEQKISPATGEAHQLICLKALALFANAPVQNNETQTGKGR